MPKSTPRKVDHKTWREQGNGLFGLDVNDWILKCPSCGHPQSVRECRASGMETSAIGFSCIGRWYQGVEKVAEAFREQDKGGGCTYAGGGLFKLNPVTVVHEDEPGLEVAYFEFGCPTCKGWGRLPSDVELPDGSTGTCDAIDGPVCEACAGTGFWKAPQRPCPACAGVGTADGNDCPVCGGDGVEPLILREPDASTEADAVRFRWMLDGHGYFMEENMLCGPWLDTTDPGEARKARQEIDEAMNETAKHDGLTLDEYRSKLLDGPG